MPRRGKAEKKIGCVQHDCAECQKAPKLRALLREALKRHDEQGGPTDVIERWAAATRAILGIKCPTCGHTE